MRASLLYSNPIYLTFVEKRIIFSDVVLLGILFIILPLLMLIHKVVVFDDDEFRGLLIITMIVLGITELIICIWKILVEAGVIVRCG